MNDFRKDFPILQDPKYIYFDNAATTQRPTQVLDAVKKFYDTENANPLRGLYEWSVNATDAYENARANVASFIGAKDPAEIIFTRNATESLNLAAYSYGRTFVKEGDEIVVSVSEHHSNILPWQMAARETGAKLVWLECDEEGGYSDEELGKITDKTAVVAIAEVSNVLGNVKPIKKIAEIAHKHGAVIVCDGAQSAPHIPVNVTEADVDFFAFSGHKLLAPMGIGVLYGKKDLLENMPPFLSGGEMIEYVTRESATYAELPHKFEAGTVNAAGAVGLSAAIDYVRDHVGFDYIMKQEETLTEALLAEMEKLPYVTVYGSRDPKKHCGIVTFNIEGCHPHDVASILDADHVCIRAGHHCAQPLMQYMKVNATCRASLYFYNTMDEVERFARSLGHVREELGY